MIEALARPIAGFEHVARCYDARLDRVVATIRLGEFYVTGRDESIGTLLGSCVAACVWDPTSGVGGMNHFLVPGPGEAPASATGHLHHYQYGIYAMEFLISRIVAAGGSRSHLLVKLVGGGRVVRQAMDIGWHNVRFARSYLANEQIEVVSEHVGGEFARRVLFEPRTGRCRVRRVGQVERVETEAVTRRENEFADGLGQPSPAGSIELF